MNYKYCTSLKKCDGTSGNKIKQIMGVYFWFVAHVDVKFPHPTPYPHVHQGTRKTLIDPSFRHSHTGRREREICSGPVASQLSFSYTAFASRYCADQWVTEINYILLVKTYRSAKDHLKAKSVFHKKSFGTLTLTLVTKRTPYFANEGSFVRSAVKHTPAAILGKQRNVINKLSEVRRTPVLLRLNKLFDKNIGTVG